MPVHFSRSKAKLEKRVYVNELDVVSQLLYVLIENTPNHNVYLQPDLCRSRAGPQVIKLEYSLKLKIKRNDWLLVDRCPQAANHCALFLRLAACGQVSASSQSLRFILSLRMNSSFITLEPGLLSISPNLNKHSNIIILIYLEGALLSLLLL